MRSRGLVERLAPTLLAICGCGALTAAKILGETAGIERFKSPDAYARHNGTAPLPVWSSNRARHRLSRSGNRQLNAALHRIALTQARLPPRRASPARPSTRQRRRRPRSTPRPQTPPLRRRLPRTQSRRHHRTTTRRLTEEQGTLPSRSPKWILNASRAFVQPRVRVHCGTAFWIAR